MQIYVKLFKVILYICFIVLYIRSPPFNTFLKFALSTSFCYSESCSKLLRYTGLSLEYYIQLYHPKGVRIKKIVGKGRKIVIAYGGENNMSLLKKDRGKHNSRFRLRKQCQFLEQGGNI